MSNQTAQKARENKKKRLQSALRANLQRRKAPAKSKPSATESTRPVESSPQ